MQTACCEMPWVRALRVGALVLAIVLGLEWTLPVVGIAQPIQGPAASSTPAASVGTQELPPMQVAEDIEVRSPFYKKWWFWTIVGVVLVGGGAAAMGGGGGGSGSSSPAASGPGNVNVTW